MYKFYVVGGLMAFFDFLFDIKHVELTFDVGDECNYTYEIKARMRNITDSELKREVIRKAEERFGKKIIKVVSYKVT